MSEVGGGGGGRWGQRITEIGHWAFSENVCIPLMFWRMTVILLIINQVFKVLNLIRNRSWALVVIFKFFYNENC